MTTASSGMYLEYPGNLLKNNKKTDMEKLVQSLFFFTTQLMISANEYLSSNQKTAWEEIPKLCLLEFWNMLDTANSNRS